MAVLALSLLLGVIGFLSIIEDDVREEGCEHVFFYTFGSFGGACYDIWKNGKLVSIFAILILTCIGPLVLLLAFLPKKGRATLKKMATYLL